MNKLLQPDAAPDLDELFHRPCAVKCGKNVGMSTVTIGGKAVCRDCADLAKQAQIMGKPMPAAKAEIPAPIAAPVAPAVSLDPLTAAIVAAIQPHLAAKLDEDAVKAIVLESIEGVAVELASVLDAKLAEFTKPKELLVKTPAIPDGVNVGRQHRGFDTLMGMINARDEKGNRLNIAIDGPAGTGKTTAAETAAKALGMPFSFTGAVVETYKLFGCPDVHGKVNVTPFRTAWTDGGVFCFDDFNRGDKQANSELNAVLANGVCAFPDGMVPRHPDCVIILTANGLHSGPTADYAAAEKQDGAFLDRFVDLYWDIDEDLERDTCRDKDWVKRVQSIRAKVKAKGVKVLITPRATYNGAALMRSGLTMAQAELACLRKGMTEEQWRSVC